MIGGGAMVVVSSNRVSPTNIVHLFGQLGTELEGMDNGHERCFA